MEKYLSYIFYCILLWRAGIRNNFRFQRRRPKIKKKKWRRWWKKFLCSAPLHHYITDPSLLALQKLQVVRVRVMEKTLRLLCATATVSITVGTAAPHQCLDPTKPPSTSVAFFVTLRFSKLVLYLAILKTFHVKNAIPVDKNMKLYKYNNTIFLQPCAKFELHTIRYTIFTIII